METINIKLPEFKPETWRGAYAQIRPYRKNGLRLEHELIKDKHIFHDYGHGGAGVSLAYGSSYLSVESLNRVQSAYINENCAVLGAGIVGLFTALQLSKRRHNVTVYSQKFSTIKEKDNNKCITSQIAPGLWLPYCYQMKDQMNHNIISKLSYQFFKDCLKFKRYQSIKPVKVYDQCFSDPYLKQNLPEWLYDAKFRKVMINHGQGGIPQQYTQFETIRIDVQCFLEEIKLQCKLRGVKFVQKKFDSLDDVLNLEEQYIWNCTGMGAKKLFKDENMVGIRGHLLYYDNPDPATFNYFLGNKKAIKKQIPSLPDEQLERAIYMYCHDRKICIGYSTEQGQQQPKLDEKVVEKLKNNLHAFLSEQKIRPKL